MSIGMTTSQAAILIGYFTGTYPRATDTFIQREVQGLRARGIDVRTFSVRKSGVEHDVSDEILTEKTNTFYILPVNPVRLLISNIAALFEAPGAFLATLQLAWRTAQPGWRGMLWQIFYFQEAIVLAREMRRQQIQHLHNHLGDASGNVTLLACRLGGVGYSMTIHGPHIFFDPIHWALREKVKYCRFTACISHYCRSQMMLFADNEDWGRLVIVHCGVDQLLFKQSSVRPNARGLLYVGRLAVEKGVPVLLESLALLIAQGYDFELTLVGDGPDGDFLKTSAQNLGIADKVMFAGYANQEEVRSHLQRCDVFLLPSFAEGVPVSLMEAMACGVPVIATYVGGVAELVEDGETGLVVYPGDPISLKNAIARYANDHALRERVSRQGRDKVVAEFNIDTEVDKLAALFKQNVSGSTT